MSNESVFLIAEAGVNHNGDINLAKDLIDVVAESGADAIKFQTFVPKELVTISAGKAEYQITEDDESQLSMLESLALPLEVFADLKHYADSKPIEFMSTAFESTSLSVLAQLKLKRFKIPSGELTNLPFLIDHAKLDVPLIVSTGMGSLDEIECALASIYWGRSQNHYPESVRSMLDVWRVRDENINLNTTLLHCTSSYPAAPSSVNMRALTTMAGEFGLPIGYSDHTEGNTASVLSIGMGATVIEKHVTLSKTMTGPDHKASMSPDELVRWVSACREAETMLGSGLKQSQNNEENVKTVARKSLVAKRVIAKGEPFSAENIAIKRPGTGRPPEDYFSLLDQLAGRDYEPDDFID